MKNVLKRKNRFPSLILQYSLIIVLACTLFVPSVFAIPPAGPGTTTGGPGTTTGGPGTTTGGPGTTTGGPGTTTGNGVSITTKIKNPLGDKLTDIPSFIAAIINFVLIIGVPIVALAIIYCGFLFVTAAGNSEKLTKAKKALLYTLIGAALLLGSFVISKAIVGTVEEIRKTT
jgi:uncharacterized RDD family membrane protein YckC